MAVADYAVIGDLHQVVPRSAPRSGGSRAATGPSADKERPAGLTPGRPRPIPAGRGRLVAECRAGLDGVEAQGHEPPVISLSV